MKDEDQVTAKPEKDKADELYDQMEKARVAREQATRVRRGRRLIVPFRDTIPQERVEQ